MNVELEKEKVKGDIQVAMEKRSEEKKEVKGEA